MQLRLRVVRCQNMTLHRLIVWTGGISALLAAMPVLLVAAF